VRVAGFDARQDARNFVHGRHQGACNSRRNVPAQPRERLRESLTQCVSNLMRGQVFSFPLGLTMSIAAAGPRCLDFFGTPLVIEPSPGSSPAGNAKSRIAFGVSDRNALRT
jgi:hypothetical protein